MTFGQRDNEGALDLQNQCQEVFCKNNPVSELLQFNKLSIEYI